MPDGGETAAGPPADAFPTVANRLRLGLGAVRSPLNPCGSFSRLPATTRAVLTRKDRTCHRQGMRFNRPRARSVRSATYDSLALLATNAAAHRTLARCSRRSLLGLVTCRSDGFRYLRH